MVRPEWRQEIDRRIKEAMQEGKKVDLTLQQWIDYTYPFNGARTNTKFSGSSQSGAGVQLIQQNFIPATRNPLLSEFLGRPPFSAAEIANLRRLVEAVR